MKNRAKPWLIGIGGILALALVLIGAAALMISDLNATRPWLNRTVSAAIDRPFAINGDLRIHWVRDVANVHYWLPRPQITAEDMVIGSSAADEADAGVDFARAKKITAVIDPLPLLGRTVVLPLLDIERAQLVLKRRNDGSNNWTFGKSNAPAPDPAKRWRVAPGLLRLHDTWVQFDDAKRQLSTRISADSYAQGVRWTVTGTLNDAPLHGSGMAGSLLALQDKKTPYPIAFTLDAGASHIEAKGTLTNPSQLAALDVKLKLSGPSMAQLYPLTGIVLPETPPYATAGHLTGVLDNYGGRWRYDKFSGKVGDSDLQGTVEYRGRKSRPLLTADLVSKNLNLADLAPWIGADSNASKERRQSRVRQPPDKLLPIEPFKTERWRSIDARLTFRGERIVREKATPLENLTLQLHLTDGVVTLAPLQFGIAGGTLAAKIRIDAREQPPRAVIDLTTRGLQLRELFPTSATMQPSLGHINGSAELTSQGRSVAELAATANGELRLFMDRATLSKFLLEAAGLNIANAVAAKVFGDEQIKLNCAAAHFKVSDGLMQSEGFLLDTEDTVIRVDGSVDLGRERLDLMVKPQTKGLRIITLRGPLHINGTFKEPDVGIDKTTVLRGGGAVALGAIALPAALIPLIATGNAQLPDDNGCAQLLALATAKTQSQEKSEPGKSRTQQP